MKKNSGKFFSKNLRGRRLKTRLDWDDLVQPESTLQQLKQLETWLQHGDTLLDDWGMRGKIEPGFRALFHGPTGTGKTLAAKLLGKSTGRKIYRVRLSAVVSKYIGETEKNLDRLFAKAERRNWILFFDEADALFGRRTGIKDAHDKYANQEVAYLLEHLEGYSGLAILAGNFKAGIDEAAIRRFQAVIPFPAPDAEARLTLWKKAFPKKARLEGNVDLNQIAEKYALNQAAVMNVVQHCCLRALERDTKVIGMQDVETAIRNQFRHDHPHDIRDRDG